MRFTAALVAIVASAAACGAASAGDWRHGVPAAHHHYRHAVPAPMLVVYDDGPGVATRAYWAPPWRNRHYFPFTGKKPKVGRRENLAAVRPAPKPAESFHREWTTIDLYPPTMHMPPADYRSQAPHLAPLK